MSHHKIITRPVKLQDLTFDDLYSDIDKQWRRKAIRLQNRRWRIINQRKVRPFADIKKGGGYETIMERFI